MRFDAVQSVGRALMLPISVLPLAGLLLRLGQPDLMDLTLLVATGNALFANLGLLFAAGIAVGLAKENHGAAGLAGIVCFLVLTEGAKSILASPIDVAAGAATAAWRDAAIAKVSVPAGIASGLAAGALYNRFHAIRVPEYLAFFGGRRFVPIVAGGAGLIGAVVLGLGLPAITRGMDALSAWTLASGPVGLFVYGTANRLLLVTGLHHILNNMAWFVVGEYAGATGDLKRFFAGDPTAGAFMTGFFPVMMFGLPAACLAMYRAAPPDRRKAVGGMLLSLALTSFLTGVTEPIEFTFLFLAPVLYAIHAVLTGVSMVLMNALGVKLGFTFSAGLADYLINFGMDTRPLLLLPVGAGYFATYYALFSIAIRRFNLATPGREPPEDAGPIGQAAVPASRAAGFVEALGGAPNLLAVDACTTRLRLRLRDPAAADDTALRRLGARGVLRPGGGAVQVVLGPIADSVAGEIRAALGNPPPASAEASSTSATDAGDLGEVMALFGGAANVVRSTVRGNRVLIDVEREPDALPALVPGRVRGVIRTAPGSYQIVLAPDHPEHRS